MIKVPGLDDYFAVVHLFCLNFDNMGKKKKKCHFCHFFLSFFLYVLTSVEDIRRGSLYKCKLGRGGGGGAGRGRSWIKEVNS